MHTSILRNLKLLIVKTVSVFDRTAVLGRPTYLKKWCKIFLKLLERIKTFVSKASKCIYVVPHTLQTGAIQYVAYS